MLTAVGLDGRLTASDLRVGGAVAVLTGLALWAMRRSVRPVDQCARYELGHREGFREGYGEGRRVGRPVVVPLSRRNVDSCGSGGACCRNEHAEDTVGDGDRIDSPEWSGDGAG